MLSLRVSRGEVGRSRPWPLRLGQAIRPRREGGHHLLREVVRLGRKALRLPARTSGAGQGGCQPTAQRAELLRIFGEAGLEVGQLLGVVVRAVPGRDAAPQEVETDLRS